MNPLLLASLGIGLVGGFAQMLGRGKANEQLDKLLATDPNQANFGLAKALLNAKMPGQTDIEKDIYGTQANELAYAKKYATDASQAQAMGATAQAQTNNAFNQLGIEAKKDYQNRFLNVERTGQSAFSDLVGIRAAQQQNRQNNWGSVSNLGFGLANFGLQAGKMGSFGGGQQTPNQLPQYNSFSGNSPAPFMNNEFGGVTPPSSLNGMTDIQMNDLIEYLNQQQQYNQFNQQPQ